MSEPFLFANSLAGLSRVRPPDALRADRRSADRRTAERRGAPRSVGIPLRVFVSEPTGDASAAGWVLDCSAGGLCLTIGAALGPGVRLRVRPCDAPEASPWTLVEVRNCRLNGGCWELGCRFVVDTTPEAEQDAGR